MGWWLQNVSNLLSALNKPYIGSNSDERVYSQLCFCLALLLGLNLIPDLKRNLYIRTTTEDAGKKVGVFKSPESTKNLLLCSLYTKVRSGHERSIAAISRLVVPSPHIRVMREVKSDWRMGRISAGMHQHYLLTVLEFHWKNFMTTVAFLERPIPKILSNFWDSSRCYRPRVRVDLGIITLKRWFHDHQNRQFPDYCPYCRM